MNPASEFWASVSSWYKERVHVNKHQILGGADFIGAGVFILKSSQHKMFYLVLFPPLKREPSFWAPGRKGILFREMFSPESNAWKQVKPLHVENYRPHRCIWLIAANARCCQLSLLAHAVRTKMTLITTSSSSLVGTVHWQKGYPVRKLIITSALLEIQENGEKKVSEWIFLKVMKVTQ